MTHLLTLELKKSKTKEVIFVSRIAYPDGVTKITFAVFDEKQNYQLFYAEFINNTILN